MIGELNEHIDCVLEHPEYLKKLVTDQQQLLEDLWN